LVLISEGKCILILGAGFGALTTANLLRKNLSISSEPVEHQITITDRKDYFMMGLVNLWILNVTRTLDDSKIALNRLENKGISFLDGEITAIDIVILSQDCYDQRIFDSQIKIRLYGGSIRIRICT
jgi:NADH dehydrogenase FAD-containing subunit